MVEMVTGLIGDPRYLFSALVAALRQYHVEATLCKNPGQKQYALRAGDEAEGSQGNPS